MNCDFFKNYIRTRENFEKISFSVRKLNYYCFSISLNGQCTLKHCILQEQNYCSQNKTKLI